MSTRKITRKRQAFIDAYFICGFNGTAAARMAGYAGNDATLAQIAYENLRIPEIAAAIDARMAEHAMSANEILARLTDHARGDIGDIYDESTGAIDWQKARQMGRTSLIKKIEQTTVTTEDSEIHTFKLELHDPQKAMQLLGKWRKIFIDRVQIDDWRSQAIEDIRAGTLPYKALVEAFDDTLAQELFRLAGVSVMVDEDG